MTLFIGAGAISTLLSCLLSRYRCTAYLDPINSRERYVYLVAMPIWLMWLASMITIAEYNLVSSASNGLMLAGCTYVTLSAMMLLVLRPRRTGEPWIDHSARNVLIGPALCAPLLFDMLLNSIVILPWRRRSMWRTGSGVSVDTQASVLSVTNPPLGPPPTAAQQAKLEHRRAGPATPPQEQTELTQQQQQQQHKRKTSDTITTPGLDGFTADNDGSEDQQ